MFAYFNLQKKAPDLLYYILFCNGKFVPSILFVYMALNYSTALYHIQTVVSISVFPRKNLRSHVSKTF